MAMMIVRFGLLACMSALTISLGPLVAAQARTGGPASPTNTKEAVKMHATGSFDVKLTPQTPAPGIEAAKLGRMTIDKQFHGDLTAASLGEMLAMRTEVQGSAGYVAMERVTGTLHGRKGSFVLQHSGTMDRGVSSLALTVVPDSGTDELTGLSGAMTIEIDQGKHSYTMDYVLP
jgi:hypothetical protein